MNRTYRNLGLICALCLGLGSGFANAPSSYPTVHHSTSMSTSKHHSGSKDDSNEFLKETSITAFINQQLAQIQAEIAKLHTKGTDDSSLLNQEQQLIQKEMALLQALLSSLNNANSQLTNPSIDSPF